MLLLDGFTRRVVVSIALVSAAAAGVLAPAEAADDIRRTAHCDTDEKTFHVMHHGKRKIAIRVSARGCIEHHVRQDGGAQTITCSFVTTVQGFRQPRSEVDFLTKRLETRRSWSTTSATSNAFNGVSCPRGAKFEVRQVWGGRYKLVVPWGEDLYADPRVAVVVHGQVFQASVDPEHIVRIDKLAGRWTFGKDEFPTRRRASA